MFLAADTLEVQPEIIASPSLTLKLRLRKFLSEYYVLVVPKFIKKIKSWELKNPVTVATS